MNKNFYLKLLLVLPILNSCTIDSSPNLSNYIPECVKDHPYTAGLVTLSALGASYFTYQQLQGYEECWNWKLLEQKDENGKSIVTNISFPNNFLWGTASSALQTEGRKTADGSWINNSWTAYEEEVIKKTVQTFCGYQYGLLHISPLYKYTLVKEPRVPEEKRVGEACHHWDLYPQDIQLAADLQFNAYRFSLEWSKIEPQKGVFDSNAMDHYIDYARELIAKGLQPIPTLFHHAWPLWFNYPDQDPTMKNPRKPAFEDARNIADFVEFAVYVFNAFAQAGLLKDVRLWLTFNEPAGYALAAYVHGKYPPGKKLFLKDCGIFLKNMLDAHIQVYDAFKKIDAEVKISLAHMMQPIQPYHPWNHLDQLPAKIFDYLLNEVTLIYLQTGKFNWIWLLNEYNRDAIGKLDFIGINYYTHTLLKLFKLASRPGELTADADEGSQGKSLYAEGLYSSIIKVAKLMPGMPIIITENGCASNNDDFRTLYLQRHLYVIQKLMQEGVDIRGYLAWTLTDCYGWNSGNNSTYGIFQVNWETQERIFRKGAQYLVDVVRESKNSEAAIQPL